MSPWLPSLVLAASLGAAHASSHREAPAISLDPSADLTDFYAFVNPNNPDKVVFILNVNPLSAPGGGPNFHRFDDNVLYRIHIDNEGDGLEDITLAFRFTTTYNLPGEFLYNVGPITSAASLNQTQTFIAGRWDDGVFTGRVTPAGQSCTVAPSNVGVVSTPVGAYNPEGSTPGTLTSSHVCQYGGIRVFAGPRQEGFFVDLERTFDLLNLANVDNTNTLLGYNVHSIAIEVPIVGLTRDNMEPDAAEGNHVIAAWATTARRRDRVLNSDGTQLNSGPYVQVARLGNPLVNEVVLPVSEKDRFNGSQPIDDVQFLDYVLDPILPNYIEAVLGVPNPLNTPGNCDNGLGFGGREDLVLAFLTGHPALGTLPTGYALGGAIPGEPGKVFGAFEALRLNLTTPSGFPNGRLPGDDVVDVALSAMVGLLCDGSTLSDGVGSGGLSYLNGFPFLGDPWAGDDHPFGFHDL